MKNKSLGSRPTAHLRVSGYFAAAAACLTAYEPNLALRLGPVLAIVALMLANPHRTRIGATEWLLVAYVTWAGASILWAEDNTGFGVAFLSLLASTIIFLGVRASARWGNNLIFIVAGFIAGTLVGLARTTLGLVGVATVQRDFEGRLTQVGDLNVNYVGYAAATAVLLLVLELNRARRGKKFAVFAAAIIAVISAGILATDTRGALVSATLLALWILLSKFNISIRFLLTITAAAIYVSSSGYADQLLDSFNFGSGNRGLSGRVELWEIARNAWESNFFEGVGYAGIRNLTPTGLPAHNMYLELGGSLGLVGLTLFLLFLASCFANSNAQESVRARRWRVGAIVVALLPITLSGAWESTAAAWTALALLSQFATRESDSLLTTSADTQQLPPNTTTIKSPRVPFVD